MNRIAIALLVVSATSVELDAQAQPITGDRIASHNLAFSGATLSIREAGFPISRRTFILVGANGHRQELKLERGGGKAGNASLNLFWADSDKYFLISEKDCVEFDPVRVRAKFCPARPRCESGKIRGLTYLGRYDWMNGFDSPKGLFRLGFRFLPFTDALQSEACP